MAYNIKLEVFEGPFDLLVYLIEKSQMDIYDIPISKITKQYIDYIEMMQNLNLEVVSEFLVLAATLIEIKSKMLLPANKKLNMAEEEQEDPRSELIQKILEYKKFKNVANMLQENEEKSSKIFRKVQEDFSLYSQEEYIEYIDVDIDQFVNAFNTFLKKRKKIYDIQKKYTEKIQGERISLEDKITQIKESFENASKLDFSNLIQDFYDKYEVIVTFSAMLELIRQKYIKVQQSVNFGTIILTKNKGAA
ncbi:MAG: segregation/condensation protein A [Clostridia bacterium]|nr:segregation/condensation protein A [Clostridia bacterium]